MYLLFFHIILLCIVYPVSAFSQGLGGADGGKTLSNKPEELSTQPNHASQKYSSEAGHYSPMALDLGIRLLASGTKKSNELVSPYSIQAVLSSLALAARGQTKIELLNLLLGNKKDLLPMHWDALPMQGLPESAARSNRIKSLTKIFIDQQFRLKSEFRKNLIKNFGTKIDRTDFAKKSEETRRYINDDIKRATEGLVPELLPMGSISSETPMVVTNALYFKGQWLHRFRKQNTYQGPFFVRPDKKSQVELMKVTEHF